MDFAIREEMAVKPEDFLLRRSGLNWFAASALREAALAVAEIFAARFNQSSDRGSASLDNFMSLQGQAVRE